MRLFISIGASCALSKASLPAVQEELRIAHCGGFHAAPVNLLVKAINVVASLLGHPIYWDTETVGCDPSLSSIPVNMQRTFANAVAELAQWLFLPENKDEFILVFLDEQRDLYTWVSFHNTACTKAYEHANTTRHL